MRIAYLLPAPGIPVQGPSGSSAHVRDICGALAEDHDVRLYAVKKFDHRGSYGLDFPAIVTGCPGWPSWLSSYREMVEVRAARRVERAVLQSVDNGWRPDLIIERHTLFSDAGWRLSRELGVPWVLEVNAPPILERSRFETVLRPKWAQKWQRKVLLAAPTIVVVSRWLQEWLQREIGCTNVHYLPNGCNPVRGNRRRGRALLGIGAADKVIGFVGSMKSWHGFLSLPPIARELGMELVLVGPEKMVDGAICRSFYNPQELADVVSAFDVGIAPYSPDSPQWFCPLKIQLYRTQGVPVVATNVGEIGSLVGDGGMVVPPGDPVLLRHAIEESIGSKVIAHCYSWKQVAAEMLKIAKNYGIDKSVCGT